MANVLSFRAHFLLANFGEKINVKVGDLELDLVDLLDGVLDKLVGLDLRNLLVKNALFDEVQLFDEAVKVLFVVVSSLIRVR